MEKFMESFTPVLIYVVGVLSCFLVMTYKSGLRSSDVTERIKSCEQKIKDIDKTVSSNILTVGNANLAIDKVKNDLACFVGKVDKRDLEIDKKLQSNSDGYDNLQEHCAKLRDSLLDVKEIVVSKRPIHRHDPVTVTLPIGVFNNKTIKENKSLMKGLSK